MLFRQLKQQQLRHFGQFVVILTVKITSPDLQCTKGRTLISSYGIIFGLLTGGDGPGVTSIFSEAGGGIGAAWLVTG